jgi:hypothetical protein
MLLTMQSCVAGILYYGQPEETVGPTVRCDMEFGAHTVFTVSDGLTYEPTFVGHMVEFRSGTNVQAGSSYNVSLSTQILGSGGYVFNELTPEAAWLYTQYCFGTLSGFVYSEDDLDEDQRACESQLRYAIGVFQGLWTIDEQYGENLQGRGWIAEAEACGWTGVGQVRVMNISTPLRDGSSIDHKDYLCMVAGAAPAETPPVEPVEIYVEEDPDQSPMGSVPVVILGSDDFDVTTIDDPGSIILLDIDDDDFDGAEPIDYSVDDLDGDGDLDLVVIYDTDEVLDSVDVDADAVVIIGVTDDGEPFMGADVVDLHKRHRHRCKHKGHNCTDKMGKGHTKYRGKGHDKCECQHKKHKVNKGNAYGQTGGNGKTNHGNGKGNEYGQNGGNDNGSKGGGLSGKGKKK